MVPTSSATLLNISHGPKLKRVIISFCITSSFIERARVCVCKRVKRMSKKEKEKRRGTRASDKEELLNM